MFDTLHLYLPQERAGNTDMLAQTPVYLQHIAQHERVDNIYYTGQLDNMRLSVSDRGVSVKGSLAKYHLNDNLQTLTRQDTEQAINSLSDELHLNLQKANISRVDFAHNFIMRYKPVTYYNYLGESQYFKRYLQPESLYYKNGNRTKLFYDKRSEAKNKQVTVPEVLRDRNVLRYEIRYKRRLGKQLNEPEVTAKTLFKEQFYIKLVKRYVADYQSIHKNPEINFDIENMSTPKDFWRQLALMKVDEIGLNETMQLVEELRAKDVMNKSEYYSRLKREIRDYSKNLKASDSSHLVAELDSKISSLKRYYR